MKLLIFAHTPPPVHGQSVMVKMLLDGLGQRPDFDLAHVDVRLSRDNADVGSWRMGKIFGLLGSCFQAWRLRLRGGPAVFYYVPAPGKRGALYRDFIVMLLCRPLFSGLVLHWHGVGLGAWLETQAKGPERWLARRLLGKADLSIALSPALAADAQSLAPRRVALVPNGIADPRDDQAALVPRRTRSRCEVLFLGLCSREKGLFDVVEALALLASRAPGRFHLTIAGEFSSAADEQELHARLAALPAGVAEYIGFANEARKRALFAEADVFCFPTRYPHEGQPIALIEALAHDVRIVTTRWRAIPEMLPAEHVWYVKSGGAEDVAAALIAASEAPSPRGALRRHYAENFTPEHHISALASALQSVSGESRREVRPAVAAEARR